MARNNSAYEGLYQALDKVLTQRQTKQTEDVHFLAYTLDPRNVDRSKPLDLVVRNKAEKLIKQYIPKEPLWKLARH